MSITDKSFFREMTRNNLSMKGEFTDSSNKSSNIINVSSSYSNKFDSVGKSVINDISIFDKEGIFKFSIL